jgi:riboflavin kinase/FMN adenylyltransferase
MEIINLSYPISEDIIVGVTRPQVMAIGQFDGLHVGHRSVIQAAIDLAARSNLPSAVMTFHPHPKEVMKKGDYEGYLTPPNKKEQLLRDMGVDYLYIIEFNDAFSRVSPQNFVCGMLLPLQVQTAVVGFDFRYGYRGEGEAETLRDLSQNTMDVITLPPLLIDGEKVSSSGIRKALQEGGVDLAGRWLGRYYSVSGTVMHGEKRGRLLGFPTANLKPNEHFVLPAKGVYAVKVNHEGTSIPGVMNVGVKPTFHDNVVAPSLEIHLLDFSGDLYGKTLEVDLVQFIRSEQKFDSIDKLVTQITSDANTARELLSQIQ